MVIQDKQATADQGLLIVSEMRLNFRQWAIAMAIVALIAVATPRLWKHFERFDVGADGRIPYQLSNDYWLFDWRLEKIAGPEPIVVLGDSVVWGEYVKSNGTLPHFLSRQAGQPGRFVNAGVNGLFPLALEGLVRNYGAALHDRKLIVVCNLLWLSSPRADLQAKKAGNINHASLLPQFFPRIPSYQPDANERISAVMQRNVDFLGWVSHLQDTYFQQKSILQWTLDEDPKRPLYYPNSYRDPLAQIAMTVPSGWGDEAERGEGSLRHKPWTAGGAGKTSFEWVSLASSLQWAAFQRTIALLRDRGNDVLVIVAPFNAHMMGEKNAAEYAAIHGGVVKWLSESGVPCLAPDELPSDLYADASHPLTAGYAMLAKTIFKTDAFQEFIKPVPLAKWQKAATTD